MLGSLSDILSFYKEEMAGETDNYVHDRARIVKKSTSSVLNDVVKDVIASVERSRKI